MAFRWKPTPWVHWLCAHSEFVLTTYRTWSGFSSIPTQQRHKSFKRDLANTFQSCKYSDPQRCKGYLQRCIELEALDLGIRMLDNGTIVRENVFEPVVGKRKRD